MMWNRIVATVACAAWIVGCGAPEPEPIQIETEVAGLSWSGSSLTGTALYGSSIYSASTNLINRTDVSALPSYSIYAGVGPNGTSTDGLSESGLSDMMINAALLETMGTEISAVLEDDREVRLRVERAYIQTQTGLLFYEVVSRIDDDEWRPLCGEHPDGGPALAVAVPGVWTLSARTSDDVVGGWRDSANEFNFACRGSSVGKCVEMGYAPREGGFDFITSAYHQACVRMLRADYCGDGTSHTEDGREIAYWDSMRIQERTEASWDFEASWTSRGASCIARPRIVSDDWPTCVQERMAETCSDTSFFYVLRSASEGSDDEDEVEARESDDTEDDSDSSSTRKRRRGKKNRD